jgi:hypothetical protein
MSIQLCCKFLLFKILRFKFFKREILIQISACNHPEYKILRKTPGRWRGGRGYAASQFVAAIPSVRNAD